MSPVDPNAPFLQRIAQARRGDGEASTEPFFLNTRAIGTYDVNRRADPFEMLGQSVEATLTARMRNDTRLAIIDGLQNSPVGSQTIRLADDADDLRQQASRVIEVFRNGVRERYLTSNLTAQLMQFDPYIAQYPALFIPKRIFETSVVGPITMFAQIGGFAPVTAIRDAIGGAVTRPQGLAAPTIRGTLAAIPEQLWAKAQGALSTRMQQGFIDGGLPLPTWLMDAPRQQRFADTIADSYARTLYHQANESGGFDASLMKNTIEIGTTALSEVGRTIREGTSGISIPGGAAALRRIGNMTQGMISLFNVIQDAPRYSAIRNTVRDGTTSVEEATGLARQLTGDVTKSGRVYSPDGRRLEADAVDQGVLNLANRPIGAVTEVLREGTPFFNPMIQGNRRLIQAIVEDPVGFNARAWLNIGLPSLAFYGWNEMLGQEYNDYAMQRRSARDVVMSQYIGIPGLPPERGIEIPLMHELLTFSAPFTRSLYSLTRGESQEEMRAAMSIVSETILSNSVEVSFPTAGAAVANIAGISAPDSIMRPSEGVYQIREDELGVLPENMEHLARTLFGSIADMSIDVANAMAGDMSFDTFYQEIRNNVLSRSAVVDGPLGVRPSNTMFGIPNARREAQWESVNNFRAVWDAHLNPDRHNEDGLETPSSADGYTNLQGAEVASEDLPYTMFGPEQIPEPINPLYEQIGEIIVENIQRNELGMSGLVRREQIYNKYLREIRDFNAGNGEALVNWQALVSGITPVNEETAKLQEMLTDNNIDISDYEDRIRLINLIESSRADIINSQGQLFDNVEATITEILREQGFEGEFDVTRHLDPNDPDPLGMAGQ
jgi:hypothetical protein